MQLQHDLHYPPYTAPHHGGLPIRRADASTPLEFYMSKDDWMAAHALPKPRKADRKRATIDTSDLAHPKRHFTRDDDYKAYVREQACLMAWHGPCQGVIQAAHLAHGGRGIKGSDASCIPLCGLHHLCLDSNVLEWQIIAHLWARAFELREEYHRLELAKWVKESE